MRPLRALLVAAVLAAIWLVWRYPTAERDAMNARESASRAASRAPSAATPRPSAPQARPLLIEETLPAYAAVGDVFDFGFEPAYWREQPEGYRRLPSAQPAAYRVVYVEAPAPRPRRVKTAYPGDAADGYEPAFGSDEPPRRRSRTRRSAFVDDMSTHLAETDDLETERAMGMETGTGTGTGDGRPARPAPPSPQATRAFGLASRAYERLERGDRRGADSLFAGAVAADPGHPNAPAWTAERKRLNDRWSASGFLHARDSDGESVDTGAATLAPVLGGGQVGGSIAYRVNPLSSRPVSLFVRANAANDVQTGVDQESAQAALGVAWRPIPDLPATIAAERLIGLGRSARDDWALRVAGGVDREFRRRKLRLAAYAEAGVIGTEERDTYAAGQARLTRPLELGETIRLRPGLGVWASMQRTDRTVSRVDLGPTLELNWSRLPPVTFAVDYRLRATGNARPKNGVAVTVAGEF